MPAWFLFLGVRGRLGGMESVSHELQFLLFWVSVGAVGLLIGYVINRLMLPRTRTKPTAIAEPTPAAEAGFRHISEFDLPIGNPDDFDYYTSQRTALLQDVDEPHIDQHEQTIKEFYTDSETYIQQFDAFAEKHGLIGRVAADHICYKCASAESFEHIRALFEHESEYMHQAIISNRRIVYIRLKYPISTTLGPIYFLELSDQKVDGSQKEGFDHVEIYPTAQSYEDTIAQLELFETVTKVERPHHTTHDIDIGGGFLFRCTEGPLIEKIKNSEMN